MYFQPPPNPNMISSANVLYLSREFPVRKWKNDFITLDRKGILSRFEHGKLKENIDIKPTAWYIKHGAKAVHKYGVVQLPYGASQDLLLCIPRDLTLNPMTLCWLLFKDPREIHHWKTMLSGFRVAFNAKPRSLVNRLIIPTISRPTSRISSRSKSKRKTSTIKTEPKKESTDEVTSLANNLETIDLTKIKNDLSENGEEYETIIANKYTEKTDDDAIAAVIYFESDEGFAGLFLIEGIMDGFENEDELKRHYYHDKKNTFQMVEFNPQ